MKLLDWFGRSAAGEAVDDPAAGIPSGSIESAMLEGLDFQAAVAARQKWKTWLRDCAGEVLVSVYAGREAEEDLRGDFSRLSLRVQRHLSELFLEANKQA
jgi:hypothetical protein